MRAVWLIMLAWWLGLLACVLVDSCEARAEAPGAPLSQEEHLVRVVLVEAAGEPLAGQVAVAGVVLDRVKDVRFPGSVRQVAYQPWQFTGMRYPDRQYSQAELDMARRAVAAARRGVRPCGRVLWYHTCDIARRPAWADVFIPVCVIGNHVFWVD